jgi:glutaredoxin
VAFRNFLRRLAENPEFRRKARTRVLCAMLAVSVLALIVDRGSGWYFDPRRANAAGHVVVYTTRWCPVCKRLRQCLRRSGVPFDERDVEASWRARAEWSALDGYGVPLTLVGREIAYGMRQGQLQSALATAGYHADCWAQGGAGALSDSLLPRRSR